MGLDASQWTYREDITKAHQRKHDPVNLSLHLLVLLFRDIYRLGKSVHLHVRGLASCDVNFDMAAGSILVFCVGLVVVDMVRHLE